MVRIDGEVQGRATAGSPVFLGVGGEALVEPGGKLADATLARHLGEDVRQLVARDPGGGLVDVDEIGKDAGTAGDDLLLEGLTLALLEDAAILGVGPHVDAGLEIEGDIEQLADLLDNGRALPVEALRRRLIVAVVPEGEVLVPNLDPGETGVFVTPELRVGFDHIAIGRGELPEPLDVGAGGDPDLSAVDGNLGGEARDFAAGNFCLQASDRALGEDAVEEDRRLDEVTAVEQGVERDLARIEVEELRGADDRGRGLRAQAGAEQAREGQRDQDDRQRDHRRHCQGWRPQRQACGQDPRSHHGPPCRSARSRQIRRRPGRSAS